MQPLRKFHKYILPNVQGCPIGVVDNAILSTVIDFCEKSLLWKKESEKTDVRAGQARYTYSPGSDAKVVQAVYAALEHQPLIPTSLAELDEYDPQWRDAVSERPTKYFMDTDESIRLVGAPLNDMPAALDVHVALKPSRDASETPDFIYEDWAEVIADGALAKLHAMPSRSWADPRVVAFYHRRYRQGLSRARGKSTKSWQGNVQTIIKPRKFGEYF